MYYREICVLVVSSERQERIGEQVKKVEIDERKFDKRKYHKRRRIAREWIFGGHVPNRTTKTLKEIILEYVQLGTKIISDYWKDYNTRRLQDL